MGHLLSSVNKEASDAIQPEPQAAPRPDVGELVIYHMRVGHARQGRTRFPALVQSHGERNTLGLTVILEAAELKNETLVEEIGPGRDSHVWERPDGSHFAGIFRGTLTALHTRVGDLEGENKALRDIVLGDFDAPKISLIAILQDFENRLRAIKQENKELRAFIDRAPAAASRSAAKVKTKKK